jgi:gamma-glutamylcyclotransferase (GGCT)/AIG2-like uncharacterized protein YtfP|tara:strand:+ start:2829 stop:3560 length:732 start_codon:yes stop_codon:yes gene_type:complete
MSFKRFIFGTDNHGDLICPEARKKFLQFVDDWKPHYKIHGGDVWDFGYLRRGAGEEDKAHGIREDYAAGMSFLRDYKPHYLTLGNHDDRVWMNTSGTTDGLLREACQDIAAQSERVFKQMKIKWVPYHVSKHLVLPEGGPKLLHGFRATMYPAKAHYENWGPSISGHVHKPDEYTARHIDGLQAFSVGCLADINKLTYADRTPAKLAWRNGWLYGYINTKTGHWNAWNVKKENGHWISPQGVL